uniref:Putative retrotransposon protein n=1 Tax=Tanacetum cinerariifolium TaxID=118510 RepID=A0A6L2MEG5_TANCI|nr:putative retrotransposon protein [Tanacetum cinerariifolium]
MVKLEGLVNPKYPNQVCKLQRSIYGLKQASTQWNKRFDEEIKKFGFTQNHDEPCVYVKASEGNVTFLILYIDDILIMRNHIPMLQDVKSYLGKCFSMKDLEEVAYIIGIKIYIDRSRNTKDMFLIYGGDMKWELRVTCYADAVYQTDADDSNSQTGYVFVYNGGVVDWKSAKLCMVPINEEQISMYYDNTGAIIIANELVITRGAKHYQTKVQYLQEVIELGDIRLAKVHTGDNVTDPFTKALPFNKYSSHTKSIGLFPVSSLI